VAEPYAHMPSLPSENDTPHTNITGGGDIEEGTARSRQVSSPLVQGLRMHTDLENKHRFTPIKSVFILGVLLVHSY
jgi:hypothetical protein